MNCPYFLLFYSVFAYKDHPLTKLERYLKNPTQFKCNCQKMFNNQHDCNDILQDMVVFDAINTITLRLKRRFYPHCELS